MKKQLQISVPVNEKWTDIVAESTIAFIKLSIVLKKIDNRSKFEKLYDSVSNFLFGGKSFFTKISNSR